MEFVENGIEGIRIQKIYIGTSMFSIKADKGKKYSKFNRPEGEFKNYQSKLRINGGTVKYIENNILKLAWKPIS